MQPISKLGFNEERWQKILEALEQLAPYMRDEHASQIKVGIQTISNQPLVNAYPLLMEALSQAAAGQFGTLVPLNDMLGFQKVFDGCITMIAAMLHDHLRELQFWYTKMTAPLIHARSITYVEGVLWKGTPEEIKQFLKSLYHSPLVDLFNAYGGMFFFGNRVDARHRFLGSRDIVIEDEHNREFLEQWATLYELLKLVELFLPES